MLSLEGRREEPKRQRPLASWRFGARTLEPRFKSCFLVRNLQGFIWNAGRFDFDLSFSVTWCGDIIASIRNAPRGVLTRSRRTLGDENSQCERPFGGLALGLGLPHHRRRSRRRTRRDMLGRIQARSPTEGRPPERCCS